MLKEKQIIYTLNNVIINHVNPLNLLFCCLAISLAFGNSGDTLLNMERNRYGVPEVTPLVSMRHLQY